MKDTTNYGYIIPRQLIYFRPRIFIPGFGGFFYRPGFSDVGELFTLPNVDGNLTPLSTMLFILTALILGTIFDSEHL